MFYCNFIKKETLAHVFSCESCEISKNTFFAEHLRVTASLRFKKILTLHPVRTRLVQTRHYYLLHYFEVKQIEAVFRR